jgi:hypothetical protein
MDRRNNNNANGDATQLSLFDDAPVEEQSAQAPLVQVPQPAPEEMVPDPHGKLVPIVVFKVHAGWANGDTSPSALECLAETVLLDITVCYWGPPIAQVAEKDRWRLECGFSLPGYERYYYRCVSSGVVDGKVWGAYTYEKCLMDLTRRRNPYEREEDDL